ncbi:DedA family protein [Arthrobacter sp. AL08]|uniref:DedA family protein n=1 Tax=unclassified Arthrobacter TaxID=235627 RepID=UPI001D000D74|nr:MULTISPECIES: DedA family protein [unclassified Arthrobacter]MCB5282457.1 Inner membrane protein YqjA [Arthrobacter sp. ES1]MDI3242293.1 DedA family protein [Arthrobacter sp. AL05]MDI3278303.1 DedA family protein [Arthrobacter sp. AL08]WGZ78084.1 DedA family protein [Arthrobacter sp. EM1]
MPAVDGVDGVGGLAGLAARAVDALGEWGVGLFTLAETVFPPIPSEVILPLAGFLTRQGSINMALVLGTSTLGAYLGSLLLYWLGARLGLERSIRWLSRVPLMDREDCEKAADWFSRHGKSAVFFGRLLPGVRSLISLPAGAGRMHLGTFSAFTVAGSGIWNALLIGLGALLGAQYRLIDEYSRFFNVAAYAALAAVAGWLILKGIRRRNSRSGRGGA